jgi:hypothetical protein
VPTLTLAPWLSAGRSFFYCDGAAGSFHQALVWRGWVGEVEASVSIGFRLEAPALRQGPGVDGVDGVEAKTILLDVVAIVRCPSDVS